MFSSAPIASSSLRTWSMHPCHVVLIAAMAASRPFSCGIAVVSASSESLVAALSGPFRCSQPDAFSRDERSEPIDRGGDDRVGFRCKVPGIARRR